MPIHFDPELTCTSQLVRTSGGRVIGVPLPDWQVNLLLRELEVRAIHGFVWDVRGQCIPNGHGSSLPQ
jgi:hypothetical protein